jgi:LacI family transcriptional regulator
VSRDTEEKVRAAIRRIGYEPNEAAKVLKGQRARILGLIVPDLADPFFAICANAIQVAARKAEYMTLMVASGHQSNVERQQVEMMIQRHIAGIIIIPTSLDNDHFLTARKNELPIVWLDRPSENTDADAVLVDNREATMRLVEHLVEHGHRQILCMTEERKLFTNSERIGGYMQAMRQAKLTTMVRMIGSTSGTVAEQLPSILASKPRPTAIFATCNLIAAAVLRQLQSMHLDVPHEMALAAFDDFDAATLMSPQITVVQQPVYNLGCNAVSLLLERIKSGNTKSATQIVLKTELVIRESCGCGVAKAISKRKAIPGRRQ